MTNARGAVSELSQRERSTARERRSLRRAVVSGLMLGTLTMTTTIANAETRSWNLYDSFSQSVFIPFARDTANGSGAEFSKAPALSISIGGVRRAVTMDTGSTGIMLSAGKIPDYDRLKARAIAAGASMGSEYLSSSKRLYVGYWVPQEVTFHDSNGEVLATASVPVLGGEAVTRCPGYDEAVDGASCGGAVPTTPPTSTVIYMGVGFARSGNGMPQGTPDKNVLINPTRMGSAKTTPDRLRRGYIITERGVHIGLTAANTAGFSFVKLSPDPARRGEWLAAPMCVSVNGSACAVGTLLVDTGVPQMYLTFPKTGVRVSTTQAHNKSSGVAATVLDGDNTVTVLVPGDTADLDASSVAFRHTPNTTPSDFTAANPPTPYMSIPWRSDKRPPFVNTGRHFLRGFHYLYDADGGWVGFKRVGGGDLGFNRRLALTGQVTLPDGFHSDLPIHLYGPTTLIAEGTATFSGPVSGHGHLTVGAPEGGGVGEKGRVTMSGADSHSGGTTVRAGTILSR